PSPISASIPAISRRSPRAPMFAKAAHTTGKRRARTGKRLRRIGAIARRQDAAERIDLLGDGIDRCEIGIGWQEGRLALQRRRESAEPGRAEEPRRALQRMSLARDGIALAGAPV